MKVDTSVRMELESSSVAQSTLLSDPVYGNESLWNSMHFSSSWTSTIFTCNENFILGNKICIKFKGSFYYLTFESLIFCCCIFRYVIYSKISSKKSIIWSRDRWLSVSNFLFTICMFQKRKTRFSQNNVSKLGAHDFSKNVQPNTFKFPTFIININIYGVTKRF